MLSSLRSVTPTLWGLVCRKRPSASASFHVAVPLPPVPSPPAARVIGDTLGSLLQCTGPTLATFQSSASLSILLNKDTKGFPSWWRTSLPPDLLDAPTQVCLPHHNTPLPLSHFFHEWEHLQGVSLWVLRTVRSGYTLRFGRNPPRFDGVHLKVVSSTSKSSVLQLELSSLLLKGAIEELPQSDLEQGFFSSYFLEPKRDGGLWSILYLHCLNLSLYKVQDVDVEDYYVPDSSGRLVRHCRPEGCLFSHSGCPAAQEIPSVCFWREGLPVQGSSLWPGLGAEDVHKMHGCCSGPFEAPGHSCTQPPGWLAHSGLLQGVSELSQRYRPLPNSCSRPQTRVFSPLLDKLCFWGFICISFKCKPSGSCPDFQFQCMLGLLQARPSCLCEHLLQAPRPHGPSLPCAASRVAPHEAVPLANETVEDPLQRTSHSSNQGVSQLLTHPLNMARSHFSPEWSQNRCDSPSPHG